MSGMAEVLAAHTAWATTNPDDEWLVTCVDCRVTLGTYESIVPKDVDRSGGSYDLLDAALATHQAAMLTAAGFGPVKGEKRLMELAALMAYDAVEEGALREAKAVALEEAADAIEPHVVQFFKVAQDLNDPHRAWLRARAAAVRGES